MNQPIQPLTTLDAIVHDMTGDERMERVVTACAARAQEEWRELRLGDDSRDHRLQIHVQPRLAVELREDEILKRREQPEADDQSSAEDRDLQFEMLPQGLDEFRSRYIDGEDNWILVTEIAGVGKSVLSYQLLNMLSEGRERFLVVRWEDDWPTSIEDLERELQSIVAETAATRNLKPADVIDWLAKNKRIVLIFDALDQVDASTQKLISRIETSKHGFVRNLRLIVTSRPNAVNVKPKVFTKTKWRHFRLQPFDESQQQQYRDGLAHYWDGDGRPVDSAKRVLDLWQDVTANADAELFTLPNNLKHIREIIEDTLVTGQPLRRFRTSGDLYWETAYRNLKRDPNMGEADDVDEDEIEELFRAAAYLAFELFLETGTYFVRGTKRKTVKDRAKVRLGTSDEQWKVWDRKLEDSIKQSDTVLRRNNTKELSFPFQKSLEFFVGLFLARYADDAALGELRAFQGDPKWDNAWRFAIEMLETTDDTGEAIHDEDVYERSMCFLFSRPVGTYARPTELMHRAWCLMSRSDEFDGLDAVLDSYRSDFHSTLASDNLQDAQLAASLLIDADVEDLVTAGKTGGRCITDLRPPETRYPSYDLCSDRAKGDESGSDDWLHFLIGKPTTDEPQESGKPNDDGEFADWQRRDIPAFWMSTTCVSREQYRLFDEVREASNMDGDYGKTRRSALPDCPITHVSWHDSFCFGLWLGDGYALPREEQWEGACWGGVERAVNTDYVLGIEPYHRGFTTSDVNYDGNYPLSEKDEDKSHYLERTLPVVWDESRHAVAGLSATEWERGCCKHAAYRSNAFGLWHMHGNVDEWCQTAWLESLEESLVAPHGEADSNVQSRVLRGGSWFLDARDTVASDRGGIRVGDRIYTVGFRLTRTR